MPTICNTYNKELGRIALDAVALYRRNTSFDPQCHYTVTLPHGELTRLHGGGRGDVYLFTHQNQRYCLKYFHDSRLISRIRNSLGQGKATLSLKTSKKLQHLGINAPRTFDIIKTNILGSPLLIMEMLEGCQQLNLLLLDWKKERGDLSTTAEFQELAQSFGLFSRNLHTKNVLHRDFSPRNVLVRHSGTAFEFYLIDLEDVYFGSKSHEDLAHFNRRLPRYLSEIEYTSFLKQFQSAYI